MIEHDRAHHYWFLCENGPKMSERVIEIDWASIHTSMSMKFSFDIFDHSIRKLVEPKLVFKILRMVRAIVLLFIPRNIASALV